MENTITPDQAQAQLDQMALIAKRNILMNEIIRTNAQVQSMRPPPAPAKPSNPETPKTPVSKEKPPQAKESTKPKPKPKPKKTTTTYKAEKSNKEDVDVNHDEARSAMKTIDGVPLELYDYFTIPPISIEPDSLKRLQYISGWVSSFKTIKEGIKKLYGTDIKLGGADMGETKLAKIYNWLRVTGGK